MQFLRLLKIKYKLGEDGGDRVDIKRGGGDLTNQVGHF
jgi:hypothetical protein